MLRESPSVLNKSLKDERLVVELSFDILHQNRRTQSGRTLRYNGCLIFLSIAFLKQIPNRTKCKKGTAGALRGAQ